MQAFLFLFGFFLIMGGAGNGDIQMLHPAVARAQGITDAWVYGPCIIGIILCFIAVAIDREG